MFSEQEKVKMLVKCLNQGAAILREDQLTEKETEAMMNKPGFNVPMRFSGLLALFGLEFTLWEKLGCYQIIGPDRLVISPESRLSQLKDEFKGFDDLIDTRSFKVFRCLVTRYATPVPAFTLEGSDNDIRQLERCLKAKSIAHTGIIPLEEGVANLTVFCRSAKPKLAEFLEIVNSFDLIKEQAAGTAIGGVGVPQSVPVSALVVASAAASVPTADHTTKPG